MLDYGKSAAVKLAKDLTAVIGRNGHIMLVNAVGAIVGQVKASDVRKALATLADQALKAATKRA